MIRLALLWILLAPAWAPASADFDHGDWDTLLKRHVHPLQQGRVTQVDYQGMAADRARLRAYLSRLSAVSGPEFDRWSRDGQLAFLINAYNAYTVELVLDGYPGIDSIKDLGSFFRSPWRRRFIPLLGETRSLDDIEHGLIRGSGRYREPRIHFALNCASIGCPALRPEAYTGARLELQLEEATRLFLGDRDRNRLRGGTLEVSSLFKWYREDFEQGWRGTDGLGGFLAVYAAALDLDPPTARGLAAGAIDIEFLPYDWHLNRRP